MPEPNPIQEFYRENPRMVSSPFGGVDGIKEDLLKAVLRKLDIDVRGKHVLDIGCGRGYAGGVVTALGGAYTGMDFVRSRCGFPLVLGDAARLPFPARAFDTAFCIDAFEHFPAPENAAREIHRVLKPGGVFFLSAPNYGNVAGLVKTFCERRGVYRVNTWAPFGRWQPQEFEQPLTRRWTRRLFRRAGFRVTRVLGYGPETGLGLFPWIEHPGMPDALRFRLQTLFRVAGPGIAALWPGASLHLFWRMEKE